jgi:acyl-CoA thioesterase-1
LRPLEFQNAMTKHVRRVGICYSLAAIVATTCCASAAAPTAPSSSETSGTAGERRGVVLVLGDSLSVSPSLSEAFPAELQKRVTADNPGWTVKNAGVSGDTTTGGLRRFDETLISDTRVLVLELGANDGLRGVDIPTVEKNLSAMIERAQSHGVKVLLCGMETPPLNGWN